MHIVISAATTVGHFIALIPAPTGSHQRVAKSNC
jgi:hypothetical protein